MGLLANITDNRYHHSRECSSSIFLVANIFSALINLRKREWSETRRIKNYLCRILKGLGKNVWIVPLSLKRAALSTWDSKKKSILKHSLKPQLISERKRINVLTWIVNGGLHESNTLG